VEDVQAVDLPLWKQPEMVELAKSLGWPLGISLFAALILLGLVRPAIKGMGKPRAVPVVAGGQGGQLDALESEALERPALPAPTRAEDLPATPEQLRLEDARTLAKQNPVAVANILKTWVNGD